METTESKEKETLKRNYGKIVLTLENAILPSDKLEADTNSQIDGLSKENEHDLRILGCELIQTAGILLKLPQVSIRQGNTRSVLRALALDTTSSRWMTKWLKTFVEFNVTERLMRKIVITRRSPWHRVKCFSSGFSTQSHSSVMTWRQSPWAASVSPQRSRRRQGDFETFSMCSVTSSK